MGRGLFDLDGPFNRIGTFIFDIVALNLIWFIFSIPIFTIGASTTALFYVVGKKMRKEDGYLFRDFWKSFRMNFRQSTIIWILIVLVILISQFNLTNLQVFGKLGKVFGVFQYVVLLQLTIIGIYIFPLLSRFYMNIAGAFKMAFIIGNKHLLTTIICILLFVTSIVLIYIMPIFLFIGISIYALASIYFIEKVLAKYMPKTEESSKQGLTEE